MPDSVSKKLIREQVLEEYNALAPDYDQKWLSYTQKTLALTLEELKPETITPNQSLLDIGCGTGQFLEILSQKAPDLSLSGVEPNLQMLSRAQEKFGNSINCVEAWAHELPFEDASFDFVTCNNMFHYIDEPMNALREFKRVLKTEGTLILLDWCADFWTMRLNAMYLNVRKMAHVKTYTQKELEDMLQEVGFSDVGVERSKVDFFWGMMVARAALRN